MDAANEAEKPRWVYRFDNYKRAFLLLREAMEIAEQRDLTPLEKEGVIQRFEYTWELAWKLIKDYLESEGVVLTKVTPASVLRAAFEAKVIDRGELWMRALDARNKMPHVYNSKTFEGVIADMQAHYLELLDFLYFSMMERLNKGAGA